MVLKSYMSKLDVGKDIILNDALVNFCYSIKLLALNIDTRLDFRTHIDLLTKKFKAAWYGINIFYINAITS